LGYVVIFHPAQKPNFDILFFLTAFCSKHRSGRTTTLTEEKAWMRSIGEIV